MVQFYFLSILCNAVAGYILTSETKSDENVEIGINFSPNNETFKLILGVLTVITGLFKLLAPVQGSVPLVGDLIPALFGFISGFFLLFKYYQKHTSLESANASILDLFLTRYKKQIGFFTIISAILHFLFPEALFL